MVGGAVLCAGGTALTFASGGTLAPVVGVVMASVGTSSAFQGASKLFSGEKISARDYFADMGMGFLSGVVEGGAGVATENVTKKLTANVAKEGYKRGTAKFAVRVAGGAASNVLTVAVEEAGDCARGKRSGKTMETTLRALAVGSGGTYSVACAGRHGGRRRSELDHPRRSESGEGGENQCSEHRITPLRKEGHQQTVEGLTRSVNPESSETEEVGERNTDWVTSCQVRELLRIGENGGGESVLLQPLDLVFDDVGGRLYVCDAVSESVLTYDREGVLLSSWSTKTTSTPSGIALDGRSGHLYMVDSSDAVVKVYDRAGSLLGAFGQGFFQKPWGIGLDPRGEGQVVVTDIGQHRVSVHRLDGSVVWTFGTKGKGDSNFQYPHRADFLSNGELVVTDYMNHCVKVISNDGRSSRKLQMGDIKRQSGPIGVTPLHNTQLVVVADDVNKQIQVFDCNSGRIRVLIDSDDLSMLKPKSLPCLHTFCERCVSVLHEQQKPLRCPICRQAHYIPAEGVSGLPDNFFIVSLAERLNASTQRRLGNVGCRTHPDQNLLFYCKEDACRKPVCTQCLLQDHSEHRITPLRKHGHQQTVEGLTRSVSPVNGETKEDGERNTDWVRNCQVRELLRTGEDGGLLQPLDLVFDDGSGRLYVCDAVSESVLTYDREGVLLSSWSTKTTSTSTPSGIALDGRSGHLYMVDSSDAVVKVYDRAGSLLGAFGQGFFQKPWGIGLDPRGEGQVVVTDIGQHRVSVHRLDGSVVWTFGTKGKGDSNFQYPHRADFLSNGELVVTDYMNHCVKVISNDGSSSRKLQMGDIKRQSGPIGVTPLHNTQLVVVADDVNKQIQVFDCNSGRIRVLIDSDDLSMLKSVRSAGNRQFAVINGHVITLYEML
ncbi:TRIM2 [Branchiostoma lanceolatum]|uniref:RING-type E3 ubiquitin transferase n=1 Tax=Branchiostoma lanceolatum TaxID=7740 RepID=A0A8K0EVS9_BRALA|nr:TRIM2 [Branchiostoma lanceolatum]